MGASLAKERGQQLFSETVFQVQLSDTQWEREPREVRHKAEPRFSRT
jgi:hypothetical protein